MNPTAAPKNYSRAAKVAEAISAPELVELLNADPSVTIYLPRKAKRHAYITSARMESTYAIMTYSYGNRHGQYTDVTLARPGWSEQPIFHFYNQDRLVTATASETTATTNTTKETNVKTTITLEDGSTAKVGDRVFNYYDRFPVTITSIDSEGWCDTAKDDGKHGPYLNGERMCSIDTAAAKGWTIKEES